MSDDDPIDDACRSIDDGKSIDWELTESKVTSEREQASARALHDLERIAEFNRALQQPRGGAEAAGGTSPEQWGHLTLLELASAGKSGEVWRAWDAWLQREVALKFLFPVDEGEGADEPLLGEARALARIRHPGVVHVYGIDAHAGRVGMWMEFLEGNSLEHEIEQRGALSPVEVAKIGLELCRALSAVVAAGLVHRDIKPSNIVLESGGRTVLTDFGLGKRAAVADRQKWRSSGTPVFMAPELLAGEAATPRSDLYALGVTLRWALTGHSPFGARTLPELREEAAAGPSARLRDERPDAPSELAEAIDRAMAPHAEARFASTARLAEALETIVDRTAEVARPPRWHRVATLGGILIVGAVALLFSRFTPKYDASPPGRFTIQAPPTMTLLPYASCQAVSPDGRLVAFVALDSTSTQRIWMRPLRSLDAQPIEGTEGGFFLFWSPDSRQLGFFTGKVMKKVAISGGLPEVLCSAPDPRGATWGKDGDIVFAPNAAGGLSMVSSEGGAVREIQRPDSSAHETALRWPHFLADGTRFFFVSLPSRDDKFDVFVAKPTSNERRRVMRAGSAPVVVGDRGVIVGDDGRLMFQRFDFDRLAPKGPPEALGGAPFSDQSIGQPLASASRNGIITHLNEPLAPTTLGLLDRSGRRQEVVPLPPGRYEWGDVSPDGKRILAGRRESPSTIGLWLVDLQSGQSRRFAQGSQSRLGGLPAWSPDGTRVAFTSNRTGRSNIYERRLDETGEERLLYESNEQFKIVDDWSPDGKYIVFEDASAKTGWDLWLLPLNGSRKAIPYLASRFNEVAGSVSPDGRWLVYSSDVSGRTEVYVRSFPEPGIEYHVSDLPGRGTWSRGGREILIGHARDDRIWSVPVTTVPTFKAGTPRILFHDAYEATWLQATPTGDRFLETRPTGGAEPVTITVDMNFPRSNER